MSEEIDLGNGWSYHFFTEKDVEGPTGLLILGPAAPQCKYRSSFSAEELTGKCGGGVHFTNSKTESRAKWTVQSENPLTLSPSIVCGCGGQHGHIVEGKYVPC